MFFVADGDIPGAARALVVAPEHTTHIPTRSPTNLTQFSEQERICATAATHFGSNNRQPAVAPARQRISSWIDIRAWLRCGTFNHIPFRPDFNFPLSVLF